MKRLVLIAPAAILLAACGGASHPSTHELPAISQKSFTDGEKAGEGIAIPNETQGQITANCKVTETEQVPAGDIASRWMQGCIIGYTEGLIKQDQSNG